MNIVLTFFTSYMFCLFFASPHVYRHKRKVQNFLPCKTPSRGPLDPNTLPGGQSLTYEDPDVHIGHHRPLVIRQHPLNMEVCKYSLHIVIKIQPLELPQHTTWWIIHLWQALFQAISFHFNALNSQHIDFHFILFFLWHQTQFFDWKIFILKTHICCDIKLQKCIKKIKRK